jgi:hypothetical protein
MNPVRAPSPGSGTVRPGTLWIGEDVRVGVTEQGLYGAACRRSRGSRRGSHGDHGGHGDHGDLSASWIGGSGDGSNHGLTASGTSAEPSITVSVAVGAALIPAVTAITVTAVQT